MQTPTLPFEAALDAMSVAGAEGQRLTFLLHRMFE